jgi:hypothetical protein
MRVLTTALTSAAIVALSTVAAPGFAAEKHDSAAPQAAGCIGANFNERRSLNSGEAICKGNYLVRMQPNGDLVLRVISTGRACWHSGTYTAGASATFHAGRPGNNPPARPYVQIAGTRLEGANNLGDLGTNANVNSNGEFWIGYAKRGAC